MLLTFQSGFDSSWACVRKDIEIKIPVHCIVLRPNVPAGMDWSIIGHFVMIFRKTADPCDPPIKVEPLENGLWRIADGRHRFFASVIAGRTEIDAEVVE